MKHIAPILLFTLATAAVIQAAPLGEPDAYAQYELEGGITGRPEIEIEKEMTIVKAEMSIGPVETVHSKEFQWFSLSFTRLNGQKYRMWILIDKWPKGKETPAVAKYIWREPNWPDAVAYIHESTGKPVLPRLSLWEYGWPKGSDGKPMAAAGGFPEHIIFQGWAFRKAKSGLDAKTLPPRKWTCIKLNPDLLIGTISKFSDVDGRPAVDLPGGRHRWKTTDNAYWRDHNEAGLTWHIARTPLPGYSWIWRSNMYIRNLFEDWPAHLYRSNAWGTSRYVNEPGCNIRPVWRAEYLKRQGKLSPTEAARMLEEKITTIVEMPEGNYSARDIHRFVDLVYGRGEMVLVERDYPVWEGFWPSAWYELAATPGVSGIVDEDAVTSTLVERYNMLFGSEIPATIKNACLLRTAVMRGAARNFSKKWGIGVYGDYEPKFKQETLREFYDAGATYFWFWNSWPATGDDGVIHLPYSYQRAYASVIRQAYQENPDRDMKGLLHSAKVAIAIPYGFTFLPSPILGFIRLHLERKTTSGITYRQILSNAAVEAERCIRKGIAFDIVVDEPRFNPKGYEEVIYIREDGTLRIVRPGQKDQVLSQARIPSRPNLGPRPAIKIKLGQGSLCEGPCEVKVEAEFIVGTGTMATEVEGHTLVYWEIFTPDNDVIRKHVPATSFEAKSAGKYLIRASTADIFGRPAFAWEEFELKNTGNK